MIDTATLLQTLESQRRHVLATLEGLDAAQLATPTGPRSWAPRDVVHHLALDVERWWFGHIVAGDPDARAYFDAHPDGAWTVPDGTDAVELYRQECARSDAIVTAAGLDARPAAWPAEFGPEDSVGGIVLHVIGETAAHAGHLDVVREELDGHRHLVLD